MRLRQYAWLVILVVDVLDVAWGAGAVISPETLLGPGGRAILPAGFEGYTGASWPQLASASPLTAGYLVLLFRMYGLFNVLFGLMGGAIAATAFRRGERWAWWVLLVSNTVALSSAMIYDKSVNAIGPFELTEYLGLALVWTALAVTAPFRAAPRPVPVAG